MLFQRFLMVKHEVSVHWWNIDRLHSKSIGVALAFRSNIDRTPQEGYLPESTIHLCNLVSQGKVRARRARIFDLTRRFEKR